MKPLFGREILESKYVFFGPKVLIPKFDLVPGLWARDLSVGFGTTFWPEIWNRIFAGNSGAASWSRNVEPHFWPEILEPLLSPEVLGLKY